MNARMANVNVKKYRAKNARPITNRVAGFVARPQFNRKSIRPAEKPKPCSVPNMLATTSDRPVNTACIAYSAGARNTNMNSRGSVIPVRNEQNATENSAPPTW
ncbi:Uncharacterised protein [Vibrio cholerae]|nr:Uncharacterised protein [Vibrio cholerae]CSC79312.1 Uncharacterised protein [Vibrio cholerae]CSI61833.1 Uncharacterised protein [Vibrio cholerae]CSI78107.1 Uncharacterised protein [Vibrio cholerae]